MIRKFALTGILALLIAAILACGEAASPTDPPAPTDAPTATAVPETPTEAAMEATQTPVAAATATQPPRR